MNCKFCQHALEEGNPVCPGCGKDNAEDIKEELTPAEETAVEEETVVETAMEEAAVEEASAQSLQEQPDEEIPAGEEKPAQETKKGITLTPGKLALLVGCVVLLTALLVALVLQGMGFRFTPAQTEPTGETGSAGDAVTESAEPTIPADGNPDDVTCKGSYTVSDDEVVSAMDTVVATMGDAELTNGQLQVFYWSQVHNFLAQYGQEAYYYYNFDYTQPLDTQVCGISADGITWQQYFLKSALENWHTYQSMALESLDQGFQLSQEQRAEIEAIPQDFATSGGLQGFDSAESYFAHSVGAGATIQDYLEYTELFYQGQLLFTQEYEKMMPTEEEVETFFNENAETYAAYGITKDSKTVDVRHILVLPEGATVDTIYTETFPEEAWAAGEAEAQRILDEWLAGEVTEDTFGYFANAHSADPGSNTNGGLYEGVAQGDMVEAFDSWCFDEARQVGDYGIVRTELGFHIMYYSGSAPLWTQYAQSDLLSQRASEMMRSIMDKYPVEVDYSAIKLGFVDMGA